MPVRFVYIMRKKMSSAVSLVRQSGLRALLSRLREYIYSRNTMWLFERVCIQGDAQQCCLSPQNLLFRIASSEDISDIIEAWPPEFADLKGVHLRDHLLLLFKQDVPCFIACDEKGIVGALWCLPWTHDLALPVQLRSRPAYEIKRLFTVPRARGKRVAFSLMLFAMKCMTDGGKSVAYSRVQSSRSASIRAHQKAGFRSLGLLTIGYRFGRSCAELNRDARPPDFVE